MKATADMYTYRVFWSGEDGAFVASVSRACKPGLRQGGPMLALSAAEFGRRARLFRPHYLNISCS